MKIITIVTFLALVLAAGVLQAAGLTRTISIDEYFLSHSLSMQNLLDNKLELKQEGGDLRDDIYEFHAKSPFKAFAYSLVVPGAGQYYNESKIKAGSFLAIDAVLWSGYFIYHGKGNSKEKAYKSYADDHYFASDFFTWWSGLDTSVQNGYSHRLYPGVKNHEYYENIGKYDQFQVGWDDIGLNFPPPAPGDTTRVGIISPHRRAYLDMRKQSNDYFANATTMAMVSIANHIISAFDAAIGARRYNRGSKQYSLQMQSKKIDGRTVPFLVMEAKF